MTVYDKEIIVVTNRERPTHGYDVGQLLFDRLEERMYELRSRNPHIWGPTESSVYMKTGKCEFVHTALKPEGIMAEMQTLGTYGKGMDANGTNGSASSGTAAVINTGFAILPPLSSDFTGFTRNSWLPYYNFKGFLPAVENVGASASVRFYSGWIKNATGPAISDDPLPQAEGGIVIGYGRNDTVWNVWHGDGTNPITKDATTIPVSATLASYKIEMIFTTATNIIINVRNFGDTLLGTITINSNVLASGKSMNWVHVIQNAAQTNKAIHGHKAEMRVTN